MKSLTECATPLSSWLFRLIGRFFPPPYTSKVLHTRQLRNRTAYRKLIIVLSWNKDHVQTVGNHIFFYICKAIYCTERCFSLSFSPSFFGFQMFEYFSTFLQSIWFLPCAFSPEFLTLNGYCKFCSYVQIDSCLRFLLNCLLLFQIKW